MIRRVFASFALRPVRLGLPVLVVGLALPFVGLERFEGDVGPLLMAFAALALAIGFFVYAHEPAAVESYAAGTAVVFLILVLIALVGVLSTTSPMALDASLLSPGL